MIKELILIIGFMTVANAVVCRLSTCFSFQCGVTTCPPGYRVKVGGGFCGCCNNCVLALNEGDECNPTVVNGAYPLKRGVTDSNPMCNYGLICDKKSHTCVKRKKGKGKDKDKSN